VSEAGLTFSSLRHGRRENRRLAWALCLSLLVHLAAWGGYELGRHEAWWQYPAFLTRRLRPLRPTPPPPAPATTPLDTEPQLAFVQVAEDDAVPPVKPKFYSDKNSHAANPEPGQNPDTPKLTGRQTDMPQTETARRTELANARPQPETRPSPEETQPQPQPAQPQPVQPEPMLKPGELAQGKPQETPQQPQPLQPPTRPRTLKEAHAQQDPNHLAGVEMNQEGGVPRIAIKPALDVIHDPFGDYDSLFIQAVQQKWYDLIDAQNYTGECIGRVTLKFIMHDDGTVTEVKTSECTVNTLYEYLCQRALTEPAPFAKWPEAMRREIGGKTRPMTFTFFYY